MSDIKLSEGCYSISQVIFIDYYDGKFLNFLTENNLFYANHCGRLYRQVGRKIEPETLGFCEVIQMHDHKY